MSTLPDDYPSDPAGFRKRFEADVARIRRWYGPRAEASSVLQWVLYKWVLYKGMGACWTPRYFWRAILNRIRDRARQRERDLRILTEFADKQAEWVPDEPSWDDIEPERLAAVRETLTGRDREMFDRRLRGETPAEIAAALGLSINTANQAWCRLIAELRRTLAPPAPPAGGPP